MKSSTIKLLVLFVAFPSCFLFGQKASKAPTPQEITKLPTPQGVEASKGEFSNKIVVKWENLKGYGKVRYIILRTPTENINDINAVLRGKVKNKYSNALFSEFEDRDLPVRNRGYYYRVQAVLRNDPKIKSDFSSADLGYLESQAAGRPDTIPSDSTKIDTSRH